MRTINKDKNKENLLDRKDLEFASALNSDLIEKKHQQIVEGACSVFFRKGYHPTTIRDIAAACTMSIGQLYHYISSKDDVLFLVHKHQQRIWYQYLEKAQLQEIKDPLQKLKEFLALSLKFMIDNKKLIQFVYSETKYLDRKHLMQVLEMDSQNVIGYWKQLLQEVHAVYPIKGEMDFISSVIAYLLAFLALRGWTLEEKPNQAHITALIDFIVRGLGLS